MRTQTWIVCFLAVSLCLLLTHARATARVRSYAEDFFSMQYCDTVNTTAWWDTTGGELKLCSFQSSLVASFDTPGSATWAAVAGDYAYVADYNRGLRVINISDPENPSPSGNSDTPGLAHYVALAGDYAYVADQSKGLMVIDITNPADPVPAGSLSTGGSCIAVEVAGDYAYVANESDQGLQVIDITDPMSPSLVANIRTGNGAKNVALAGDYAYVTDADSGLRVIDISNPTSPTRAGGVDTDGYAYGIALAGDYVYVADGNFGLQVIDTSNPANPTPVASIVIPGQSTRSVAVVGDFAYVAPREPGLQVVDISDPLNPTLLGGADVYHDAIAVTLAGDYAYVSGGESPGVAVIKIAEPVLPPELAGSCGTPDVALAVTICGDYAYVADRYSGLQVIDISDPGNPTYAGGHDTPGLAFGVAISGDFAYVADYNSGLRVIDISDPTLPADSGSCDTPGNAWDVAIDGDYAYVADETGGLQVIDISDPANPDSVGSCPTPGYAYGVAISGDYAYVADYAGGLQVIDISDPTSPTNAGSHNTPGNAWDVAVSGDYAYVADEAGGLQVINISHPTVPADSGSCPTPGYAYGVAVAGDYVYVADHSAGLQVINISDPTNPTYAGGYDTPGDAWDVGISGDYVYLADYVSGLQVIQVFQRAMAREANRGQSIDLSAYADDIVEARLTTSQNDSVTWEMSANGGSNWQVAVPDWGWNRLTYSGTDFRWRSTHIPENMRTNPMCSSLLFEFMFEFAQIETIEDISNDQGRQVRVSWVRSGHDFVGSSTPITEYALYRRIDDDLLVTGGAMPRPQRLGPLCLYPPGNWDFLIAMPACAEDEYSVVVPTLKDSTISEGMYYTTFFVRALSETIGFHFDSPPDSGYSVDNLAPVPPRDFRMMSPTALAWEEDLEADFDYFSVYGSSVPDLDETATLIGYTIGAAMDVSEDIYIYYHLTATDFSGNEGDPSSLENTYASLDHLKDVPTVYALRQNRPNPFDAGTVIAFDLPENGLIGLKVVDIEGRLVRSLVEGVWPAGRHSSAWPGDDDRGSMVAPGIYFIKMEAGEFAGTKKMIVLR